MRPFGAAQHDDQMFSIQATVVINRTRDEVFAFISDHERFLRGPGLTCRLSKEGHGHRNGVGAVRVVRAPGSVFTEEVIEFEPPRFYAYVVRKVVGPLAPFAPAHDRGWIELAPMGTRTRVDWHSRFRARVPVGGRVLERLTGAGMEGIFRRLLESAKAQLENGVTG